MRSDASASGPTRLGLKRMKPVLPTSHFLLAVLLALGAAACGSGSMTSSPTGPASATSAGATIQGTLVTGAAAAQAGVPHASGTSGIRVSITGTNLATSTDGAGRFVITGVPSGAAELHLQGPGLDARLTITGLAAGQTLTVTVRASGSSASLESDDDGQDHEAELGGAIQSIDLATGSLMVAGRKVVTNANTRIIGDHDTTLAFKGLKVGENVQVEGTTQADQSLLARKIKLQDREGDDNEVELEGTIQSINPGGSLVVAGRSVLTDGQTRIRGDQDKPLTLADLKTGQKVEVKGVAQGTAVLARTIDVTDSHDD